MTKNIRFDFNNMLADRVGDRHGLSPEGLKSMAPKANAFMEDLLKERAGGKLPFFELPYQNLREIIQFAEKKRKQFENFVVVGIGGSALGNIALQNSLNSLFWNEASPERRRGYARIYVPDNIDPEHFHHLLETLDLKKTLFNVISKSGATAETSAQFLIIRKTLEEKFGNSCRDHIVMTTDLKSGLLRQVVNEEGYENFPVPDGVGGRFSVLTPVGLLSAAMAGIDIQGLLDGVRGEIAQLDLLDGQYNALKSEVDWYSRELEATRERHRRVESRVQIYRSVMEQAQTILAELRRWSAHLGLPLNLQPRYFPVAADAAARMIIAADLAHGTASALDLAGRIMATVWVKEGNIADTNSLAALAAEARLGGTALLQRAEQEDVRNRYARYTEEAVARGVFGAPFYIYRDEPFWGQDRLDFLDRALAGD